MKKIIIIALIACMAISILSGCGSKPADANGDNTVQTEVKNSDSPDNGESSPDSSSVDPGGIYKTAGSELTDFQDALLNSEKVFEDALGSEEISSTATLDAQMAIALPNMAILSLSFYDLLSTEDVPKAEGKLALSGFDGVREKSSDEIKFSANHTYTEDTSMNKVGDKYSEKGSLNTKTNTLVIELISERDGKTTSRTVYEAVILKDGTYIIQYFNAAVSTKEDASVNTTAVFKRFNNNEYVAVTGDFEGKTDFSYDSIAGKGDLQPDAMAKNYSVTGKFTVKDGKAVFSK